MAKVSRISPKIPSLLPRLDKRFVWIGMGILAFFLTQLFKWNPPFTEIVYSRGIFLGFRWVWDHSLGLLPIPLLYVLICLLGIWLGRKFWLTSKNFKGVKWRYRLGSLFLSLLAIIGLVYFLFQFLWGFNYYRVPVQEQLDLRLVEMDSTDVYEEARWATENMLKNRQLIAASMDESLGYQNLPNALESKARRALEQVLMESQYPTNGRVRGRILWPKGFLLRLGASGIYIPFVGEGHIDAALPAASRPFTLAHELSHGYGFGDEGTANFWGYLATQASDDPSIRYSGSLAYWRYTARSLVLLNPTAFRAMRDTLPNGIMEDLKAIRQVYDDYPDFFPSFNEVVYDSYLKSQGVSEGKLSYNKIVPMVRAWREGKRL